MDNFLSVYQYPTLTVMIDDSQSFLDSLAFQLSSELASKGFHDTQAAINWLLHAHRYSVLNKNEPITVGYDEQTESFQRRNATIDLDRIYRMAMDGQRFEMPTVLVVDYAMPQMNGLEFCHAVQDLPCKKILLTGQADEKIAIEAFNRNLIDCFIKKNDPDAVNHLETEIIKLQKNFFIGQTNTLKDLLSRHSYAFLSDPAMGLLIGELCSRCRYVEYYLFPNPAGILFLDVHGKASLMVIETETSLKTHVEVAQYQDAPSELLTALLEHRLIPFFSDTDGMYQENVGYNWLSYCKPPQICRGRQDYYWAFFDLPPKYLQGPVYSYEEFLRDHATGSSGYPPV